MKVYNKNFKKDFNVLFDYISIKGIYNSTSDDVFINKTNLKISNKIYGTYLESEKELIYIHSMFGKDDGVELFIDEFKNIYVFDEIENLLNGDYSQKCELFIDSYDSKEPNPMLNNILKVLTNYIKNDKQYIAFKLNEKLSKELNTKEIITTKKVKI